MNRAAYDAAREASVLAWREDRTVLALEGRDPVAMLQGLASNDVRPAAAGRCVYATLLTPKGRMVADLRVLPGGDGALLLAVPTAAAEEVAAHFGRFVPPRMARLGPSQYAMLGLYGPDAISRAAGVLDGTSPKADEDALTGAPGGTLVVGTRYAGVPGLDLFAERGRLDQLAAALGANGVPMIDADTLEVLRIEAGSPRWGAELDDRRIPIEAGLTDRAISNSKGCYTGQEVIVRILHRGHVNWHLRGFEGAGAGAGGAPSTPASAGAGAADAAPDPAADRPHPLAPGSELTEPGADKKVASVTSVAMSPRLGPIALGYARRELDPGAALVTAEGASVRLVTLPFGGG